MKKTVQDYFYSLNKVNIQIIYDSKDVFKNAGTKDKTKSHAKTTTEIHKGYYITK